MPKKIFAALIFIVAGTFFASAENFPREAQWNSVFAAKDEARPRDLVAECENLLAAAAEASAWSEYALAAQLRADALGDIAGDMNPFARVESLRESLAAAPAREVKIFIEARLASALLESARNAHGNAAEKTVFDDGADVPAEPLAELSAAQLSALAVRHYENVLAQEDFLKKIPVGALLPSRAVMTADGKERLPGIFSLFDAAPAEFPTFYDFIARDAERFFLAAANAGFRTVSRPLPPLNDAALFAPAQEFIDAAPEPDAVNPSAELFARALRIARSREQFHVADADKSALARATLDRFALLLDSGCDFDFSADVPENALRNFIAEFAYFPIAAEGAERLALLLVKNGREAEAFEIADKAVAKYGNAKNAAGCKNILRELRGKTLDLAAFPRALPASAPAKFSVRAKNIDRVRLRVVPAEWRAYLKKEHNRPNKLSAREIAELLAAENAVELSFPLEKRYDFRLRESEIEIPAGTLAPGFYFVFPAYDDEPFGKAKFSGATNNPLPIWVGDVAAVYGNVASENEGDLRIRAVNSVTGAPIEGAAVFVWNKARWGGERLAVPVVRTDALGEAVLPALKAARDPVVLVECALPDADGAGTRTHAVSVESVSFSPKPAAEKPAAALTIFSDRRLYRPAQKISFKGVVAAPAGSGAGTPEALLGKTVKISLRERAASAVFRASKFADDARELTPAVAETEARSNDFGSFAGTLELPAELKSGAWLLRAECDGASAETVLNIEEYRRPKSELKFAEKSPAPQILGGNASALVAGKSFTGTPLAGARVNWRVFDREISETPVASGDGTLDDAGELKISWKTERKKLSVAEAEKLSPEERRRREAELCRIFEIEAETTDETGETLEAGKCVFVGNRSARIRLDGKRAQGADGGAVELFCRVFRDAADAAGVPATVEIFRRNGGERGEKVFSAEIFAGDGNVPALNIPAGTLAVGGYRAVARGKDAFGQEIFSEFDFSVFAPDATKFPLRENYFFVEGLNCGAGTPLRVGETAEILWGSGAETARAFVEIFAGDGKKRLAAFYTDAGRTQQKIRVPVSEEMRGGFVVSVSQTLDGKFFENRVSCAVDWEKTLKIEPEDFRRDLVPATRENWTFKITRADGSPAADTEVLTVLYDCAAEKGALAGTGDDWRARTETALRLNPFRAVADFPRSSARDTFFRYFLFAETEFFDVFREPDWTFGFDDGNPAAGIFVARESAALGVRPTAKFSAPAETADASASSDRRENSVPAFPLRKNLRETAFFLPFLRTDENGIVNVPFVVPEALSNWRLRIFAHDRTLRFGAFDSDDVRTSKELTAQPDAPRFLREGDEVKIPVKIANRGNAPLSGEARLDLEFFDALGAKIDVPAADDAAQSFTVPAKSSTMLFRAAKAPAGAVELRFRATARSGNVADGEEIALPVLPRRVVLTQSRAALARPDAQAELVFEKLADEAAPDETDAPRSRAFRLDAPAGVFDSVLLALPRIAAQSREGKTSDAAFSSLCANALAKELCAKYPEIREKAAARGYADAAEFFDEKAIADALEDAFATLDSCRVADGWTWFPEPPRGARANARLTREILEGVARLRERVSDEKLRGRLLDLAAAPLRAADERFLEKFSGNGNAEDETRAPAPPDAETVRYLYLRELFGDDESVPAALKDARARCLAEAEKTEIRTKLPSDAQARLALALHRRGNAEAAAKIAESLRQRAVRSEELGMSWNDASPTPETQLLMIELFSDAAPDADAVNELKIRLLSRIRTRARDSADAGAEAVFVLLSGENFRAAGTPEDAGKTAEIFDEAKVEFFDADGAKLSAGTLEPARNLAKITAKNAGRAPVFVAAHWEFSQPASAVAADAGTGLSLKKSVFKRSRARGGKTELVPARLEILRPGDEIVVRLTVRADRDFEFVRLTDMRGSGCEPARKISGADVAGGLPCRVETKDAETRFFFEKLPAGTCVIEYAQRVRFSGLYTSGFAEIRPLRAQEFSARSSAESLVAM